MIPLKDDNPTHGFSYLTAFFIAANVIAFLFQLSLGRAGGQYLVASLGLVPYEVSHGVDLEPFGVVPIPFTVFSSMFLHGSVIHLAGNMLYLWIFGNNVEEALGRFRFVLFYLLGGVAAATAQILTAPNSTVPMIGASGAVAGVLGGYVLLFPRARVLTLVFVFYFVRLLWLPATVVLGLWFLLQVVQGLPSLAWSGGGGVAWFAHIGGFLAGMGLVLLFRLTGRPRRGASGWNRPAVWVDRDWTD